MRFLYCHEITGILFCLRQKGFATEARRHKGFAFGKKENCQRNTEAQKNTGSLLCLRASVANKFPEGIKNYVVKLLQQRSCPLQIFGGINLHAHVFSCNHFYGHTVL